MKVNVKKLLISLAAIMLGSFLISGIIFLAIGGMSSVIINSGQAKTLKVFPAQDITRININTVNTDINIIPVDDKNIEVDFYGNITTSLSEKTPQLNAYKEGGVLNVYIDYPSAVVFDFINAATLKLDIYIPQEFSGGISAETISGSFKTGKFNLENFEFKSLSGSLEASSLSASDIKINSTSGKVVLSDVEGGIDISNISGNVELILRSIISDLNIKTISGRVVVSLPGKSEFNFEFGSISGSIKNEFGAQIKFSDGRNIEGKVGTGVNKLTVNTTSGEIKIKKGQ
jgi:lia operon protein LiaG